MRVICTFCNSVVRETPENPDMISHGVCLSCYRAIMRTYRFDVKKYLDMLDAPVFLVDDDVNILAANTLAISLAKKPLAEIKGQICGTVLECINAYLPEGCGKTPQCPDCTIREAVNETYRTETPVTRRPASFTRNAGDAKEKIDVLVSTRKDGNVVLLKLEPSATV